jgi:hypothetical protein
MGVKVLLILIIVAILMDDGSSIKKTAEERKEDEEVAKAVNATLAAEEAEKKKEEEEKRAKKKKKEDEVKVQKVGEPEEEKKDKDEALPCFNLTCPAVKPCLPCEEEDCPQKECPAQEVCPEVDPCQPCGPCPPIHCQPCPVVNTTVQPPSTTSCPEASLSVPAAIAVGAVVSLLVSGVAVGIGLILRYVPPIVSGFLFLATVVILWYLCSQYPETAREIGGRAAALLREAAAALSHRVMAALQRHQNQVGFSVEPNLFF